MDSSYATASRTNGPLRCASPPEPPRSGRVMTRSLPIRGSTSSDEGPSRSGGGARGNSATYRKDDPAERQPFIVQARANDVGFLPSNSKPEGSGNRLWVRLAEVLRIRGERLHGLDNGPYEIGRALQCNRNALSRK